MPHLKRVLEYASVGAVISFIADLLRWSPVGRAIVLESAEGPGSDAFDGQVFRISEARAGNLIVVPCDDGVLQPASPVQYLLRPRHRGWAAGSLMATSIAVTVHELGPHESGPALAMAVARLAQVP